jgi:hypothetical protein
MASVQTISCKSCGATIDLQPGIFDYVCPYCETKNTLVQIDPSKGALPKAPEKLIAIRVSKNELHNFLLSTMASDLNSPDDFIENSVIDDELLYYVPCYFTAGSMTADWTASFGYDRQESYTAYETYTDSRGNSRTRPVTRYRTVTDWRPASGKASGRFVTQAYAGEDIPDSVRSSLNSLSGDLSDYSPTMVTGCEVRPFTQTLDGSRLTLEAQIKSRIRQIVLGYGQGDHQRDWSYHPEITVDYEKPGLLPLGKASFTYKNKQYNVYASALSLSLYYRDAFPVDHRRKNKISRAFVPFYIALAYTVVFGFIFSDHAESFNYIALGIGVIAPLVFGYLRKSAVTSFSKKVRAAALAQKDLNDNAQLKSKDEIDKLYQLSQKPLMPTLAKDGADNLLLPLMTFAWIGICLLGLLAF